MARCDGDDQENNSFEKGLVSQVRDQYISFCMVEWLGREVGLFSYHDLE
jgi:hypothetical protein